MDPILGQIIMFAGNFAPRGLAFCDGTLLPIAQNTALFSLLGTTYGGDGRTTFALPDLRGRVAIHPGQGPGLSNYALGSQGGTEATTLTTNNLPTHTHPLLATSTPQNDDSPTGNVLAQADIYAPGTANITMGTSAIGPAGESQPVANLQPYTCISAIIALEGIYPSRN
jgi:microcystin-dependent protein